MKYIFNLDLEKTRAYQKFQNLIFSFLQKLTLQLLKFFKIK